MAHIRTKILYLLLFCSFAASSQSITEAEYFFDTDPGVGNGTALAIPSGDTVDFTTNIPVNTLSTGFHQLFIRVKNDSGQWSIAHRHAFYIHAVVSDPPASQIAFAEYFFNDDPGVGNGQPISFPTGDTVNFIKNINISALPTGFHKLYFRVIDADGKWSITQRRAFYIHPVVSIPPASQITDAEYFFDTDPGVGNGVDLNISDSDTLNINPALQTTGLSPGFHRAFIRFKDQDGKWSFYQGRKFYIQPDVQPSPSGTITDLEYFIDTDPGIGNGNPLPINSGDTVEQVVSVDIDCSNTGMHYLYMRVKDEHGVWSVAAMDTFEVYQVTNGFALGLKLMLEGPYEGPEMSTHLNSAGLIPLQQPFNTAPWNYAGGEEVDTLPSVDVVDWVLLELRETTGGPATATSDSIIHRRAAFLLRDGTVIDTSGAAPFFNDSVTDNLYLVAWHRNHLGIMSSQALVNSCGIFSYEFQTGENQVYGGQNGHKELEPGIWGMAGGDGDSDGQVSNADKNDVWSLQAGNSGYQNGDFNLDTQINNIDKNNIWVPNSGTGGQVVSSPVENNVIESQVPK